ncbi:MAG: UDP-N-acetylglucosamine 1-carboxyvinyltransferase, partial [Campylobacterales bacterium]
MYKFLKIRHTPQLGGVVPISGAKNAALPLMAGAILSNRPVELGNLPEVADVKTMGRLLEKLGAQIEWGKGRVRLETGNLTGTTATYEIVKTMRASILVLGPLLARFGDCRVSLPGGCAI